VGSDAEWQWKLFGGKDFRDGVSAAVAVASMAPLMLYGDAQFPA